MYKVFYKLGECGLKKDNIEKLCKLLEMNGQLTNLSISNNETLPVTTILQTITNSKNIQYLALSITFVHLR